MKTGLIIPEDLGSVQFHLIRMGLMNPVDFGSFQFHLDQTYLVYTVDVVTLMELVCEYSSFYFHFHFIGTKLVVEYSS